MSTVLISGVSGDLGQITARCFANSGWKVVGLCTTELSCAAMQQQFADYPTCIFFVANLLAPSPQDELHLFLQTNPIHAVICLAGGISAGVTVEQTSADIVQSMMNTNLLTAWNLIRATLPALRQNQNGGAVITIASRSAAYQAEIGKSAYTASKAALIALTKTLAEENREFGVRAHCIVPGIINTPKNAAWSTPEERKHWTDPEDIAQMMVFLASETGKSMSGGLISMLGG